MRERGFRSPLGRIARRGLLHHAVDLLEREAFRLRHQEPRVDERGRAQAAPDEEHRRFQVPVLFADHVGRYHGDDLETRSYLI